MKRILYYTLTLSLGLLLSGGSCNPDPIPDPDTYDKGVAIGGAIWATRNVGEPGKFAATPTSAGMFYQWNRKTGWSVTDPITSSPAGVSWNATGASGTAWEPANDPCPEGWQVPTEAQMTALIATLNVWNNATPGRIFGTGVETLFLPAVGIRNQYFGFEYANSGLYWLNEGGVAEGGLVYFHSSTCIISGINSAAALPVRCVKK